jgi:hypothetical protein
MLLPRWLYRTQEIVRTQENSSKIGSQILGDDGGDEYETML